MTQIAESPEFKLRPYVAALDVLLADVPKSARALVALLECGEANIYGMSGGDVPDWLTALRAA